MPYRFPWPNGTVSGGIKPQFDELAWNFIVAGGGANGGSFDHDDGSSVGLRPLDTPWPTRPHSTDSPCDCFAQFYLDHDNFEVYGGHKRYDRSQKV